MGLDIIAGDFPKEAKTPADIPVGWVPRTIGRPEVLADRIKSAIPIANFVSARSGFIVGDDFALEIHLGKEDECHYVHFAARVRCYLSLRLCLYGLKPVPFTTRRRCSGC